MSNLKNSNVNIVCTTQQGKTHECPGDCIGYYQGFNMCKNLKIEICSKQMEQEDKSALTESEQQHLKDSMKQNKALMQELAKL